MAESVIVDTLQLRAVPLICGADAPSPGLNYHRPQGLEDYSMIMTLGGRAEVGPPKRELTQRAGDLLLIEPHRASHQTNTDKAGWRRIWVIFAPRLHWREWFNWPELAPGFRHLHLPRGDARSTVRAHLTAMHRHASGTRQRRHDLAMNALEAALLECDFYNPGNPQTNLDPRVVAAVGFVDRNLHRRLVLDAIAEAAGLSVPHLNRLFRRQLDLSPMIYVERQRMQRATEPAEHELRSPSRRWRRRWGLQRPRSAFFQPIQAIYGDVAAGLPPRGTGRLTAGGDSWR